MWAFHSTTYCRLAAIIAYSYLSSLASLVVSLRAVFLCSGRSGSQPV
jgi:hypothetical protein